MGFLYEILVRSAIREAQIKKYMRFGLTQNGMQQKLCDQKQQLTIQKVTFFSPQDNSCDNDTLDSEPASKLNDVLEAELS